MPNIEGGFILGSTNLLMIKSSRDLLAYLSSSKELEDFTTLGVDKKGFKAALHKILLTVSSSFKVVNSNPNLAEN